MWGPDEEIVSRRMLRGSDVRNLVERRNRKEELNWLDVTNRTEKNTNIYISIYIYVYINISTQLPM